MARIDVLGLTCAAVIAACAPFGALKAQEGPKFFIEGDMVRGNAGVRQGPGCVLNSQFKHGESVVFRVGLRDAKTGKSLDSGAIKNMQVQLSNGVTLPITYKQHPGPPAAPEDFFWTGNWIVPTAHPTGSLTYKVVVTDFDGKTATWSPFARSASQLTIVDK